MADLEFDGGEVGGPRRKWDEAREFAELRLERLAEIFAVRGVERAVAQPVIRAGEGDHAVPAGGQQRGLERGLNGLEAGVAENRPSGFLRVHCSK